MSIRIKIGIVALGLIIVAIFLGYFVVSPYLKNHELIEYHEEVEIEFQQFENVTNRFLEEVDFTFDLLLENENLYVSDGTLFTNYLTAYNDGFTFNPSAVEQEIIDELQFFNDNSKISEYIYVGYETGEFIMVLPIQEDSDPETTGVNYDPRLRAWYTEALSEDGDTTFSEIQGLIDDNVLLGEDEFFVTLSKTVNDDQGNVIGVIGMDIVKNNFLDTYRTTNYEDYITHAIVLGDKILVYDEESYSIRNISGAFPDLDITLNEELGFSVTYQVLDDVEYDVLTYGVEDDFMFVQLVEHDELVAIARQTTTPLINMLMGSVIFVVLVIYGFFIVAVFKPLKEIEEKTNKIAKENDFSIRFDDKRNDEIGTINKSFNGMVSEINRMTYDMDKRIKELTCLYSVANSTRRKDSLEEIFMDTVKALKDAYQYPDITRTRILYFDKEYVLEPFMPTEHKLSANIIYDNEVKGVIEVYYIEESPQEYEGPFLKEEVDLLIAIAKTINTAIQSYLFKSNLQKRNAEFEEQIIDRTKELNKLVVAIEQSPSAVIIANQNAEIEYCNSKFTELIGYTFDEIIGQNISFIEADTDASSIFNHLIENLEEGKVIETELMNQRKDGTTFWSDTKISPLFNEAGELTSFVSIIEDITKKRTDFQEKEATLSLLDKVMDIAKLEYYQIDIATNTFVLNDRDRRYIENTSSDYEGYNIVDVDMYFNEAVHPDDADFVRDTIRQIIERDDDNDSTQIEYRVKAVGGSFNYIAGQVLGFVRNESGEALRLIGVTQDINERKEAERQIQEARIVAENATKAKSDFLANMSHEIRTPMNAIIGLTRLLENTELNNKQTDYVVKTGRAAKNLLGIINDILDFSKIEAGKLTIENVEFSLDDVLDNLSSVIGMKAFDKGIEFVIAKNFNLPNALMGDPLRLGQIILNLVNNAIKFTSKGQVFVSIEEKEVTKDQVKLEFKVTDSGIGMTPEQVGKLFKAFSQADTSTTRKYGGTGLGLSISKNLVEQMGGTIGVESEYNVGSVFYFELTFDLGSPTERKEMSIPKKLGNIKALIVDDNSAAREVMRSYLDGFGIKSHLVANGEDAIKAIDESYDVVLLDWKMPGMDGNETWLGIKEKMGDKTPKVIMVTAYGKSDVVDEAKEVGITRILMKPVSQSTLFDNIMELFGEHVTTHSRETRDAEVEGMDMVRGAKILVAEDNEINQQVAKETLEYEGFIVDIADNGKVACDLYELNKDYDIILMDLQMPLMSGYEASSYLRERGYTDVPIIALTADAMVGVQEKVIAAGMNGFVAKPIDLKELFTTLVEHIEHKERMPVQHKKQETVSQNAKLMSRLQRFKVTEALDRVAGNEKVFIGILDKYQSNFQDFIPKLKKTIQEDDITTAKRDIHTLKGVSGNIGAFETNTLSKTVEKILKEGGDVLSSNSFAELSNSLEQDIIEISSLLKEALPTEEKQETLSKDEILKRLHLMKEQIEDFDTESKRTLDEIEESLKVYKVKSLSTLRELLNDYDFDTALEVVLKIIDTIMEVK